MKKRILSGMRPTGKLHLGHLVGALDNWVKLQEEYECFFMVADWHALMSEYEDTGNISENIFDNVIDWLSAGLDPDKAVFFVQSEVPQHLDLYMVLSCFTPLGWLERCPTYKEQLREFTPHPECPTCKGGDEWAFGRDSAPRRNTENKGATAVKPWGSTTRNLNTYAFLGYPVLQAADILLYKANRVPVGEDQLPHLELTREICRRFNSLYKKGVFPEPEALLTKTPRLPGLDGRKMSKSYNNTVNLSDSPEIIAKKIGNMITDPARARRTDKGHPEVCNVHAYYAVFMPGKKTEVDAGCREAALGCTDCKKMLAAGLIDKLRPLQQKRKILLEDKDRIRKILQQGREEALKISSATMKQVREAMGL